VSGSVPLERIADVFARLDAGEGLKFAVQP